MIDAHTYHMYLIPHHFMTGLPIGCRYFVYKALHHPQKHDTIIISTGYEESQIEPGIYEIAKANLAGVYQFMLWWFCILMKQLPISGYRLVLSVHIIYITVYRFGLHSHRVYCSKYSGPTKRLLLIQ